MSMKILGIESTADESGVALLSSNGRSFTIEHNFVASQIGKHAEFGGIMPRIAAREHVKNFPVILEQVRKNIGDLSNIDAVAYSAEPGLQPSLLVGGALARGIAYFLEKPLIPINHVEAHLLAPLINDKKGSLDAYTFPMIGLAISGGHTRLYLMKSLTEFEVLGNTRDDAAGEAFDKIAAMLTLPYPGGPEIQKMAEQGDAKRFSFPQGLADSGTYEFSFSGIKTSVRYTLRDLGFEHSSPDIDDQLKADISYAAQDAITDVLVSKTLTAALEFNVKGIVVGGGVSANKPLIQKFEKMVKLLDNEFQLFAPSLSMATDNGAMIALGGLVDTST